jgi:hypothetical protein
MYPTIMCGNPRLIGFRTLRHSDIGFEAEIERCTRSLAADSRWRTGMAEPLRSQPVCLRFVRLCYKKVRFVSSGLYV